MSKKNFFDSIVQSLNLDDSNCAVSVTVDDNGVPVIEFELLDDNVLDNESDTEDDVLDSNEDNFVDDMNIKRVIFNNPATIVFWEDGTKTSVVLQDNIVDGKAYPCYNYTMEGGLGLCFLKKFCNNNAGEFNRLIRKYCVEENIAN